MSFVIGLFFFSAKN